MAGFRRPVSRMCWLTVRSWSKIPKRWTMSSPASRFTARARWRERERKETTNERDYSRKGDKNMTSNELKLIKKSGAGKMFNTGDDVIQVLQLQGSWREMGRQYGAFAKDGMQHLWDAIVQPYLDKGWTTLTDAEQLFGRRTFDTSSHRMKEMIRGIADA